jgi:hypothetical protein
MGSSTHRHQVATEYLAEPGRFTLTIADPTGY